METIIAIIVVAVTVGTILWFHKNKRSDTDVTNKGGGTTNEGLYPKDKDF